MNNAWEPAESQTQENSSPSISNGAPAQDAASRTYPASPAKSAAAADDAGRDNIDKIRDILFGGHMRDYDSRFQRLEQILLKEAADSRELTRKAVERLEGYVKQELEALQSRLKNERDERGGALSAVSKDIKEVHELLSRRIAEIDDHSTSSHHELRNQLLQHGRDLNDQIDRKQREISALLEERFLELRKEKTDRAALASLFKELGMRLNNEFSLAATDR